MNAWKPKFIFSFTFNVFKKSNMLKIIVLSGAGISAESGINTFRDTNGLWENYAIEDVATPEAWGKSRFSSIVLQCAKKTSHGSTTQ